MDKELKCKNCKYNFSFICIGKGENQITEPENDICEYFQHKKEVE